MPFVLRSGSPLPQILTGAALAFTLGWLGGSGPKRAHLPTPQVQLERIHKNGFDLVKLPDSGVWISEQEVAGEDGQPWTGSFDAAERWLADTPFRLPTPEEWTEAARGGLDGALYAWGWGEPPQGICHDAEGPQPVHVGPRNGCGFRNLAGNVAEWCADGSLRGGSWAERDIEALRIDRPYFPPAGYDDLDAGFRIVWEAEAR